jgi:hypothetical protein
MRSKFGMIASGVLVTSLALASAAALIQPAAAHAAPANGKFCALFSGQYPSIDFEGLGPAEARLGAELFGKAAKSGVPAKLKKDLKKMAKVYDRIADGESAAEVLDAAQQRRILPSVTRFSKYFATQCAPTPST